MPKVVVPMHLSGSSCEKQGIHALGQRYSLWIIEDASHGEGRAAEMSQCVIAL
jgi:dTDP-4-amino-4,6-dideoxygalactose transaminase